MIYSYSFLNTWDICNRQAYHRYVLKDAPFVETPQMKRGNEVHEAMELRVKSSTPLPEHSAQYEPIAKAIAAMPNVKAEAKYGITKDCEPCDFWAKTAYFRIKIDTSAIAGTNAKLFDYKTGKRREDAYELELQGMTLWAYNQDLRKITGRYLWLAEPHYLGKEHDVSNAPETFELLRVKTDKIEKNASLGYWPPRQSPLCGWCAVKSCEFNPGYGK